MGCGASKPKVQPVLETSKKSLKEVAPTPKKKPSSETQLSKKAPKSKPTQSKPKTFLSEPKPLPIKPEPYLITGPPDFTAAFNVISHVWGPTQLIQHRSNRILTVSSRQKLEKITNIGDETATPLWVDFYSINQEDSSDKCHQIGIMHDIYRTARQTFVCLTCEEKKKLDAVALVDFERADQCRSGMKYKGEDPTEIRNRVNLYRGALEVYNSRVWTLQESIMSQDVWYTCSCTDKPCSGVMVSRRYLLKSITSIAHFYANEAPHEMITAQLQRYTEDVSSVLGVLDPSDDTFKKSLVRHMLNRGCMQLQDYYFGMQAIANFSQKFEYTTDWQKTVRWLAAYAFPLFHFDSLEPGIDGAWFTPQTLNTQGKTMQQVFRITGVINSNANVDIHSDGINLVCENVTIATPTILGLATGMEITEFAYRHGTLQFQPHDTLAGKYNNTDNLHIAISQLLVLIAKETGLFEGRPNVSALNQVFDYLDRGARRYGYFHFCNELHDNMMSIKLAVAEMKKGGDSGTMNHVSLGQTFSKATLLERITVVVWGMRASEDGWYNPFPSFLWTLVMESLSHACCCAGLFVSVSMDGVTSVAEPVGDFSSKKLYAVKVGLTNEGGQVLGLTTASKNVLGAELICLGGSWFLTRTHVDVGEEICIVNRLEPVWGAFTHASAYSEVSGIETQRMDDYETLIIKHEKAK